MGTPSQTKAVKNYRKRLRKRGLARFEVLGLDRDREMIRVLARKLAESTPEAEKMRASVRQGISEKPAGKVSILEVLRSWPLTDLNLTRPFEEGRKIDL